MTTLKQKLETLTSERQNSVKAHAQQLIAQEHSLRALRQARQLTQVKIAELLNIRQENVSRLEKRTDLLLSTLRDYVSSMGGTLKLVVEFPDSPPVELVSLGDPSLDTLSNQSSQTQIQPDNAGIESTT